VAFAVTRSGEFPVLGCNVRAAVGGAPAVTVTPADAEPERAFEAVKVTAYGAGLASAAVGVHVRVPDVFEGAAVNVALFPAGKPVRSAPSVEMASVLGSPAVMTRWIGEPAATVVGAGADTTGA
jgi:hypothetical protein